MNGTVTRSAESLHLGRSFRREVRVEWGDCDPAGIVFYPRYLAFFDASTAYLMEAAGYSAESLRRDFGVIGMPLIDVQAKFLLPSRCGDRVVIETRIAACSRARVVIDHRLLRNEQLAVEARESRVWAAKHADAPDAAIKICTVPQQIVDRLIGAA